ncbi:predicted protein [Botrytis cinerea T4]|uniref:Uncharacterized protein n=1 Tax=Botryotinia fuckeliana (strain T4) TaxID=999810 RepID=G2XNS2_BOTF4|nr:predicted protein [Botrytis cinerea T4]
MKRMGIRRGNDENEDNVEQPEQNIFSTRLGGYTTSSTCPFPHRFQAPGYSHNLPHIPHSTVDWNQLNYSFSCGL